jgi:hypothetical protein
VTDHYLLDQYGKVGRKAHAVGPANKKIQPQVVSYKLQATSFRRQASSDTTCGCVDKFNKDLTCRIIPDTRLYK